GWAGDVEVRAVSGATTGALLELAEDGVDDEPDVAIFLTGYNDIYDDDTHPGALDEMVALAGQAPCSVWLLLPESNGYRAQLSVAWNEAVSEVAAAHPSVHVSPAWRDLIDGSDEFTYVYRQDGLHPNRKGQEALAGIMDAEADAACG